ncbi:anti-phage deoxyguanosine triphosphatase [Maridesulfovibrio frigidus]|uniref:anti-phage deoxyguanosine triphosphatase n=1 Tax=Maridesulfovibrio frigidus TaxID=340956 RepID=UPI000690F107|nr:anti-phage deoxyguanosine triphosphatase [Maridesulfovibrio frigidus]
MPDSKFMERFHKDIDPIRKTEWRSEYSRDLARIIHGAAFRRLQGKTQVMGTGEGDFHRTRLTHSMEVAQIGLGLFEGVEKGSLKEYVSDSLQPYLATAHPVISSACYAHDLGHPPFGHGGEQALHGKMKESGGFEGNAQTVRLLTRLEKYHKGKGINPTRRVLLSVLKYPASFSEYSPKAQRDSHPPKCFYQSELELINWAIEPFSEQDRKLFRSISKGKPRNMTFDASVMECADDIAYCTHDLEDIIAREIVKKDVLLDELSTYFNENGPIEIDGKKLNIDSFTPLFEDSYARKKSIGEIVNVLITSIYLKDHEEFEHPLLRYRLAINEKIEPFTDFLKKRITYGLVVSKPAVKMLERKGQRIISSLFDEYQQAPDQLIPNWDVLEGESNSRKICDYIAGMTDTYAEKIYHRMFTPGVGSSKDEL